MRNLIVLGVVGSALMLSACGRSGLNRNRPDEFAVARQAPLVIPPDFALVPPQPGAPRPQDVAPSQQALDALFGGPAQRSASEAAALQAAGRPIAEQGVRSAAGDPQTNVIDKGTTTRDIVAAPQGDGQDARAVAGSTPAAQPTPRPE
ncbi:DUF3035 domain-containing protein [Sphingomonas sp.]